MAVFFMGYSLSAVFTIVNCLPGKGNEKIELDSTDVLVYSPVLEEIVMKKWKYAAAGIAVPLILAILGFFVFGANLFASPAWESGKHTNFFMKYGIADEKDVQAKVQATYKQLFFGNERTERLFYETADGDGFISSIDSRDIRSEGMSYGMIIAVMMDDKDTFDKLWTFAKNRMQHQEGEKKGYFAWQLRNEAPYVVLDSYSAPDGEEYFVMALMFAAKRWGNGSGIYDYETEANAILHEMVHKEPTRTISPMIDPEHKQIVFSPNPPAAGFTDPSYHLPAFYELWARWAKEDNELWDEVARTSRDYFTLAAHPETGLFTEYASFDGKPYKVYFNSSSDLSAFDSFRVIQNIAVDYLWFGKDEHAVEAVNKLLGFYNAQPTIVAVYSHDGKPKVNYGSPALVAMNAVGATISGEDFAKGFVEELWNQPTPNGRWRYYNGLLHMLGMLHVSGEFKIYGNPELKE